CRHPGGDPVAAVDAPPGMDASAGSVEGGLAKVVAKPAQRNATLVHGYTFCQQPLALLLKAFRTRRKGNPPLAIDHPMPGNAGVLRQLPQCIANKPGQTRQARGTSHV